MNDDDGGHPMLGSTFVRNPEFTDRVVAETRHPAGEDSDLRSSDHAGPWRIPAAEGFVGAC